MKVPIKVRQKFLIVILCLPIISFIFAYIIDCYSNATVLTERCTDTTIGTVNSVKGETYKNKLYVTYSINDTTYTTSGQYSSIKQDMIVHYNPSNPKESYAGAYPIIPDMTIWIILLIGFIATMTLFTFKGIALLRKDNINV